MEKLDSSKTNLTQRQLLIWVKERLSPDSASNNMVMTFEIEGDLDPERFRQAFASVVAESDVLRTVFVEDEFGLPRQQFLDTSVPDLDFIDLRDEHDPRDALGRWLGARIAIPFLLSERAIDCALLRLGPSTWLWYLCQNHVISDGVSFSLIYDRVAKRYASPGVDLPAATSFEKFVEIEHAYRSSDRAAASAQFWADELSHPLEPLSLYGQRRTESDLSTRRHSFNLGQERSQALRRIAAEPECRSVTRDLSLSVLFTAVLIAYLHRVSRTRRIGIIMPVSNRRSRSLRNTIGALFEMIAIQVDVDQTDSFLSLIGKTRDELYRVMRHAQHGLPANVRPFHAMLNFHNSPFPPFLGMPTRANSFTGLDSAPGTTHKRGHNWRSDEDLSLQVQDFDQTGTFTLDFDLGADIFSEELGLRAIGHFERLLDAMIENVSCPIQDVDIVDAAERAGSLVRFNPPRVDRPATTLVEALETCFTRHADRPAVVFAEKTLSYRQFDARSDEISRGLLASGVCPGDRVAVLLESSEELPVALLAVMRSGAAYVPIDPDHPAVRNSLILEDAKPSALLTQSKFSRLFDLGEAVPILCLDRFPEFERTGPLPTPSPSDLAYIIFTSGSTGRPKGVEITHANLMNALLAFLDEPGFGMDDTLVSVTTVAFDIVGLDFYTTLLAGARLVLADRRTALDPARLAALLERSEATLLQATPATWRMLIDDGWQGKPDLRALVGGEALSRDLADEMLKRSATVWNLYGPTEATIWCTTEKVEPVSTSEADWPVPIGRPIPNTRIYLLDEQLRPVPIGTQGALWIAGDCVGRGYCDRPDLTKFRFLQDPFVPGERMYRSGDLARYRLDGRLEFIGRDDYQVKVRGYRVELSEIERAIDAEATVHERVVISRPDGTLGNRLSAYLTGHAGIEPDVASLRALLRDRLPSYMIPADFIVLDAMPLTSNGKISRSDLPEPDPTLAGIELEYVAPATTLEKAISGIWSDLLGIERIGVHDSFFDLGGHSLTALKLFRRLKNDLGIEMPISTLFEASNVRSLSAFVDLEVSGRSDGAWSTIVRIQPAGHRIPLFCAAGVGGNINNLDRLARHLGLDQPFYGLQTRGIVGHHLQHKSIEDIALESIADLRRFRPEGPYVLAGYSAGGAVAFEMAQRLSADGHIVAGLILLDSYSPAIPRRTKWERAQLHLSRLSEDGFGYLGRKIRDRIEGDIARLNQFWRWFRTKLFPARYAHDRFIHRRAETQRRYRPDPYSGDATLFRVDRSSVDAPTELAIDEWNGWRSLILGELEVIPAPGGHLDMCEEPYVRVLAKQLTRVLDRVNETDGKPGTAETSQLIAAQETDAASNPSNDPAPV